jgi:hypothetical protein
MNETNNRNSLLQSLIITTAALIIGLALGLMAPSRIRARSGPPPEVVATPKRVTEKPEPTPASVTLTAPAGPCQQTRSRKGLYYALRDYSLSGYSVFTATHPGDLPQLVLRSDVSVYGTSDTYVIVEKVGSFEVTGPSIEVVKKSGLRRLEKVELPRGDGGNER